MQSNNHQTPASPNPTANYTHKIQQIDKYFLEYPYQDRIAELPEVYQFYVDVGKVINPRKMAIVEGLCMQFYRLLALRMLATHWGQQQGGTGEGDCAGEDLRANQRGVGKGNGTGLKKRAYTYNSFGTAKGVVEDQALGAKDQNKNGKIEGAVQAREENFLSQIWAQIKKSQQSIRQQYFDLTGSFKTKNRINKIQLICFIVALIAPEAIIPLYEMIQPKNKFKADSSEDESYDSSGVSLEAQVYIILIHETLGNLISPQVFNCLAKKYIKQKIFSSQSQGYFKLARSLKHIQEKLNSQNNIVLIKSRKKKEMPKHDRLPSHFEEIEDNAFTKDKIRTFIRDALRTNDIEINRKYRPTHREFELKKLRQSLQEKICPSYSKNEFSMGKIAIPKLTQAHMHSHSVKQKLNLDNFKLSRLESSPKQKFIGSPRTINYKLKSLSKKQIAKINRDFQYGQCKFKPIKAINEGSKTVCVLEKETIESMKSKIQKFKDETIRDLHSISKLSHHTILKQDFPSSAFESITNTQQADRNSSKKSFEQLKMIIEGKRHQKKLSGKSFKAMPSLSIDIHDRNMNFGETKEGAWHHMYNIRTDKAILTSSVPAIRFCSKNNYTMFKNSDMLRKCHQVFEIECQKRQEYIR